MGKTVVNKTDHISDPKDLVGRWRIKMVDIYCLICPASPPSSGQLLPWCSSHVILIELLITKEGRWPRPGFSEYHFPLATVIGSREVTGPKPKPIKIFSGICNLGNRKRERLFDLSSLGWDDVILKPTVAVSFATWRKPFCNTEVE